MKKNNALSKINARVKQLQKQFPNTNRRVLQKRAGAEYRRGDLGTIKKSVTRSRKKKRKVSGVATVSRKHVDKNRITANIQVGKIGAVPAATLKSELRKRLNNDIDKAVVRKFRATKKRDKAKIQKTISAKQRELRKLQ